MRSASLGTAPTTPLYSAACSLPEVGMLLQQVAAASLERDAVVQHLHCNAAT